MKKIVLTFGFIAGGICSVMMLISSSFMDQIGFDRAEIIGYTTLVLAFLMVFFGIKSYRDNVLGGSIDFGKAFQVGLLITAIGSACYVATWQVVYRKVAPDFMEKYGAHVVEKARASGATQAELDKQLADNAKFREMYKNPLINIAFTLIEPLPIGLLITLVSAGVLSRRRRSAQLGGSSLAGAAR